MNGMVHQGFSQAAQALSFVEDDSEWVRCMEEAVVYRMPSQLRHLFATILLLAKYQHPEQIWERHLADMSEDFHYANRDAYREEDEARESY